MPPSKTLEDALEDLSLAKHRTGTPTGRLSAQDTVESWEELADASSPEDDRSSKQPSATQTSISTTLTSPGARTNTPAVPPPTPASPRQAAASFSRNSLAGSRFGMNSPSRLGDADTARPSSASPPSTRPEKTTAAASRMIAAGLGLKLPKRTEEQRKYDRAAKEAEIRRRNQEKEAKRREEEEKERAKAAMWDD